MRTIFIAALTAVALAGCNADPGARREISLLRSEILELEDRYYALKSRCGDPTDELATNPVSRHQHTFSGNSNYCDDCGNYVDAVSQPPMYDDAHWDGPPQTTNSYETFNQDSLSTQPEFQRTTPDPARIKPANPLPGEPEEIDISPLNDNGSGDIRNNRVPANRVSSSSNTRAGRSPQSSTSPDKTVADAFDLILVESKTFGLDQDGDGIDDGMQISFGLVDTEGFMIQNSGRVVISLLDPALPTGEQRLGLWEHSTNKKTPMLQTRPDEQPDQVYVQWQSGAPVHAELLLFVRHILSDGTALENSIPVRVKTAGDENTDLLNLTPPSDDRTTSRGTGPAPEINIDLDQLEKSGNRSNNTNKRKMPSWRAIR